MPVNNSNLNDGNYVTWCNIDDFSICEFDPCDGLGVNIYSTPSPNGGCCFNFDMNISACMQNFGSVQVSTTTPGLTFATPTAPSTWTQSGVTPTSVTWNHTSPLSNGFYPGGKICFNTTPNGPIGLLINFYDNKGNLFCRQQKTIQCPPPCIDILQKTITCIGYDSLGQPQYSYCLSVANNSTISQIIGISSSSATFTPNSVTLLPGFNTFCGVMTLNTVTPPIGVVITIATIGGNCKFNADIKLPTNCPPQKCLEVFDVKLSCLGTSQLGNTTYQYTLGITNLSGVTPNQVVMSSNGGTEAVFTNVPATPNTYSGTLQYATPVSGQICLGFMILNANGVKVCVTNICVQAPQCPSCCSDFNKGVKVNSITNVGNISGNNNIWMDMTFAPNRPIRNMTMTIVSASRKKPLGTWERIYGDIGGASAIPGLGFGYYGGMPSSTSFELPTLKTREVEWGTNFAGFSGPFNTKVLMLFPLQVIPNDLLDYYIRIAMTDTKCVRCDTLIHVKIIRKSILPHRTTKDDPIKDETNGGDEKKGEILLSEISSNSFAKLKMIDKDKGVLKINVPVISTSSPSEKIKVVSVGFLPEPIVDLSSFTPITSNFKSSPREDTLFCNGQVSEGEYAEFNVAFNNSQFNKWDNEVIIKYLVGTAPDTIIDVVNLVAAIPVDQGGDKMDETGDKNVKTRTYSLSFTNLNKSKGTISDVELRMPKGVHLLAFGSAFGDTINLQANANFKNDTLKIENYFVAEVCCRGDNNMASKKIGLSPNEAVKPIYITVSGAESGFDLSFITTDSNGVVLSEGTLKLTNPLSTVKDNDDISALTGAAMKLDLFPNPSTNSTTINLGLQNSEVMSLTLVDINGKEVLSILKEKLLQNGNHAFVLNTQDIPSGEYIIIARTTNGGGLTKKLQINK
jgi:hypothetical protein